MAEGAREGAAIDSLVKSDREGGAVGSDGGEPAEILPRPAKTIKRTLKRMTLKKMSLGEDTDIEDRLQEGSGTVPEEDLALGDLLHRVMDHLAAIDRSSVKPGYLKVLKCSLLLVKILSYVEQCICR